MRNDALKICVIFLFVVLFISMAHIQLLKSDAYRKLAEKNILRVVPIEAPRGKIFDRKNRVLVSNRLSLDVALIYHEIIGSEEQCIDLLSAVLGVSKKEVVGRLEKSRKMPYVPVVIFEDVDKEKAIVLEQESFALKGIVIESKAERDYPFGSVGAHLIGYLGEVNRKEVERLKPYGYRLKDWVGRSGLEAYYNDYLMGKGGGLLTEVDNRGRQVQVLGLKEPSGGKDLYLTIDIAIQEQAEKLLEGVKGAIVVMNATNGEVLALASRPSFDPTVFIASDSSRSRVKLLHDTTHPLINRAITGTYPPGSVFKVVVATAGLETKRISETDSFVCTGAYALGRSLFHCWRSEGHGSQNLLEGMKNSCNVYFYSIGRRLGVDRIEQYANRFGFGRPTGIDIPEEAPGLVPGRLWKMIAQKTPWYEGETINYAIGQGYLLVTPLQITRMIAVIANDGYLVRPFLVRRIDSTDCSRVTATSLGFSPRTLRTLRQSLVNVVNAEGGTGRAARLDDVVVAGKTGTAQNPDKTPHSWFCGFAPADKPKISLTVFVEHGGKGGIIAAKLARSLFETIRNEGYL